MNTNTDTSTPFMGSYCELLAFMLELEGLFSHLVLPEGRLYAHQMRVELTLKSVIAAPCPMSEDGYRSFVSSLNLMMITAGVLLAYGKPEVKALANVRLAVFHPHYPEIKSVAGHVICGLHLSPKGREDHFARLTRMDIERKAG